MWPRRQRDALVRLELRAGFCVPFEVGREMCRPRIGRVCHGFCEMHKMRENTLERGRKGCKPVQHPGQHVEWRALRDVGHVGDHRFHLVSRRKLVKWHSWSPRNIKVLAVHIIVALRVLPCNTAGCYKAASFSQGRPGLWPKRVR